MSAAPAGGTAWIAQNCTDPTWLLAFETKPTMDDLIAAGKGSDMGPRSDWQIYSYHVHATTAGRKRRTLWSRHALPAAQLPSQPQPPQGRTS